MSDIKISLPIILKHEGGYINDPDDPGGETYKGISRRYNPRWSGWKLITKAVEIEFPGSLGRRLEDNKKLQSLVISVYRLKYWKPYKLDELVSQAIANQIFDMIVNLGHGTTIPLLQAEANGFPGEPLKVDGIIGPLTRNRINDLSLTNLVAFNNRLIKARLDKYWDLSKIDPFKLKWLKGWTNRSMSFLIKVG